MMSAIDDETDDDVDVITPATPEIENVVFVLLGIVSTVGIVIHLITLFT